MTADGCDELAVREFWGSGESRDLHDGLLPRKIWTRIEDGPEDIREVA